MKVIILGAGASRAAGYPLALELMTTIERDAVEAKNIQLADAWNRWLSVKNSAPSELRIMLDHPNPEVTLSFLDLLGPRHVIARAAQCPVGNKQCRSTAMPVGSPQIHFLRTSHIFTN
jgi:hypothetical protein